MLFCKILAFECYHCISLCACTTLFAEIVVEFTQNTFTGSEDSQSATVSLRLAVGSSVVPTGGLTVSLTASPDSASSM